MSVPTKAEIQGAFDAREKQIADGLADARSRLSQQIVVIQAGEERLAELKAVALRLQGEVSAYEDLVEKPSESA